MTRVVDVVNFNADASCLPADAWLQLLRGGPKSPLCQWLELYISRRRKVVLGFVGAAVADMKILNPESLRLINEYPEVFEVLIRPFSHDIGLLRTTRGFAANLAFGMATITREFSKVVNYFLPPEFMLTSAQVGHLATVGVEGVFINSARFKGELQGRIPETPYLLDGVMGSQVKCIPFCGQLTEAYLQSIHFYDAAHWNRAVGDVGKTAIVFSWRDGESCFLVPDSLAREAAWLNCESEHVDRRFLSQEMTNSSFSGIESRTNAFRSYPTHSFSAWFKENRMLGFLGRVEKYELRLGEMSIDAQAVWLQTINSDILSAVEKDSPTIMLGHPPGSEKASEPFTIWRSDRGFEGEDFLARLEMLMEDEEAGFGTDAEQRPHIRKLLARAKYLRTLPRLNG